MKQRTLSTTKQAMTLIMIFPGCSQNGLPMQSSISLEPGHANHSTAWWREGVRSTDLRGSPCFGQKSLAPKQYKLSLMHLYFLLVTRHSHAKRKCSELLVLFSFLAAFE